PELAADKRYADVVSRQRNRDALEAEIGAWTAGHEAQPLMERLQRAGVPAAALLHQPEMTGDPQLVERGFFQELTHPAAGTHDYPGPVAQFSRTSLTPVRGPAPTLGQHNEELLCGLIGLSQAEYQQLVDDQIVGTVYLEDAR
ncbi:MAG: CoA transferase, partial [Chloroflexi bacterium]|nr:CoA transferase [Chloroflexota bacterium]